MLRNPTFLYGCCLILLSLLASAKISIVKLRVENAKMAEELGKSVPDGCEAGKNHDRECIWLLIRMFSGLIGAFAAIYGVFES